MEEGVYPSMVSAATPAGRGGGAGRPLARDERLRRGYTEMGPLNRRLAEEWVPGELELRCWEWGGEGG